MIRYCVVCGAPYSAPPSSKKITCSKECSSVRKRQTHLGNHVPWGEDKKAAWSRRMKTDYDRESVLRASAAALEIPEGQRGPQNRAAKIWEIIAPDGTHYRIVNLQDWARHHAEWFDDPRDDADRERIAKNIAGGFQQIVRTWQGRRPKSPVRTYKSWGLASWPVEKTTTNEDD